ncbi:hypothetical protein DF157_26735 [Burkholderia cenocepacia]|nr:hypothetical protein DF157_26735 [Burkholderia cenocepacia]RQV33317.1 hypothetical protein DF028_30480 [Burkholderia cenocepacia]RQV35008.1 hypothetical protein DF027_27465 [Burkholderia cenocepacia]RQV70522.1 hypothetical protein DF010_29455 [Burkholderia cenocepacia]
MYEAICAHRPEEARTAMQTHIGCVRSHFERERRPVAHHASRAAVHDARGGGAARHAGAARLTRSSGAH